MRIWLDVANSPHVAFLAPFIKRLEDEGAKVIVTARDLGNALSLLDQRGIPYERIDGHGGKRLNAKVVAFSRRCVALARYLKGRAIDAAFTQSSFYVPLVARMAGVPSLYTNDNEHARGNYVAYLFADQMYFPEAMRSRIRPGIFRRRVAFYPGVKEGIYLSQERWPVPAGGGEGQIYFRPEPWLAQYHVPAREHSCEIVRLLLDHGPVTVLPRDQAQRTYFERVFAGRPSLSVERGVLTLGEILGSGRLFVGAGGSMSREAAVLGLPTISVYTGPALAVDDYLCELGILRRAKGLDELRKQVRFFDRRIADSDPCALIKDGERAFEQLYRSLRGLA